MALKEIWTAGHDASTDSGGAKLKSFEYLADVQPAGGGAIFRTVIHEPFDERHWIPPIVGDVVAVKCHPRRERAKFDTSAVTDDRKAQKEAERRERAAQAAQFDALRHAAPGTTVQSSMWEQGNDLSGESDREDTERTSTNARADLARQLLHMARRRGDTAEVERLTAVLADLEAGSGSQSIAP